MSHDGYAEWEHRMVATCPGRPELDRAALVMADLAFVDKAEKHGTPADCTRAAITAYLHAERHDEPISLEHQRDVIR